MLMASRLLYGLAHQDVLPRALGKVSPNTRAPYAGIIFSTLLALGLIIYVANRAEDDVVLNLASVTSLLLLGVFTVVNIACLVLRRDGRESRFRSPGLTPCARGAAPAAFLIGPWVDRTRIVYQIAGGAAADRRRALGDHLGSPTGGSGPRRPGSATSSTWTSDRRDVRTMRDARLLARTLDAVSSTVPDLEALRALGPAQQPVYPDRRGRRRRRRPPADDAAAGLRR